MRPEDSLIGSNTAGADSESFFDQVLRQIDPEPARIDPLDGTRAAAAAGAPGGGTEGRVSVPRPLDRRAAGRAPVFSSPSAQDAGSVLDRRTRRDAAQPARRRAVAVLGAFGILTGGGGWVVVNQPAAPLAQPEPREPGGIDLAAWAAEANNALAEVNRQLDIVAQTTQMWDSHPLSRRAAQPPRVVTELLARKALLEQQRTLLQSELAAYQSLSTVSTDVAESQRELGNLDRALAALPDGWQASPEQQATRDRLVAQRDTLLRRREARERELASLQGGLDGTARSPLPDTTDRTTPLASSVVDLTQPASPSPDRSSDREPAGGPPSALAQRAPFGAGRERQEVYNAAPPAGDFAEGDLVEPRGRALGRDGGPPGRALGRVVEPVEETLEPVTEPVLHTLAPPSRRPGKRPDDALSTDLPVLDGPPGPSADGEDEFIGPVAPVQDAFVDPPGAAQDAFAGPSDGSLPSEGALPARERPDGVVPGIDTQGGSQQTGSVGRSLRVGNVEIGDGIVRAGDIEVGDGRVRVGDLEVREGSVRLRGREIGRPRDRKALDDAVGSAVRAAEDAAATVRRSAGETAAGAGPTKLTGSSPTASYVTEARSNPPASASTSVAEDGGAGTRFASTGGGTSIAERAVRRLASDGEARSSRSFASSDDDRPSRVERLSQRAEKKTSKNAFRASSGSVGSPARVRDADETARPERSATRLRASRDHTGEREARAEDVGGRVSRKLRERKADQERESRGDDGDSDDSSRNDRDRGDRDRGDRGDRGDKGDKKDRGEKKSKKKDKDSGDSGENDSGGGDD